MRNSLWSKERGLGMGPPDCPSLHPCSPAVWCWAYPSTLLTFSVLLCETGMWEHHWSAGLISCLEGSVECQHTGLSEKQLFLSSNPVLCVWGSGLTNLSVKPHKSTPRSWHEQNRVDRIKPLVFALKKNHTGPSATMISSPFSALI